MPASAENATLQLRLLSDPLLSGPDGPVQIRGALQRALLLRLGSARGSTVSRADLVDALWPERPPRTAAELLSTHATRLRSTLTTCLGPDVSAIPRSDDGYRLDVALVRVDLIEVAVALAAAQSGSADRLQYSRQVLGWFGNYQPARHRDQPWLLDAMDLAWNDARSICQINIERGDPPAWDELLPQLSRLEQRAPFDEPVIAWRLEALGRTGRVAEALRGMDQARTRLLDELGARPSIALNRVFKYLLQISADEPNPDELNPDGPNPDGPNPDGPNPDGPNPDGGCPAPTQRAGDTSPRPGDATGVPQQLPLPRAGFTGRVAEINALSACLRGTGREGPALVLITGRAGVGKSALGAVLADSTKDLFPDGQFYLDFSASGFDLSAALGHALRSLEVASADVPERTADQLALLRSITADKAILWFLDDVGSGQSLELLFPNSSASAVIVTGRSVHPDLSRAAHLDLAELDTASAIDLLCTVAGADRLAGEPEAVEQLVGLCEGLPTALLLSARQLVTHPHRSVCDVVARLGNEERRLDEFSVGGGLRAALDNTVDELSDRARAVFLGVGLLRSAECQPWMLASVIDEGDEEAHELLEDLVDARLIEFVPGLGPGILRFRCSDLVRQYALQRWRRERSQTETQAAVERYLTRLLTFVERGYAGEIADGRETAQTFSTIAHELRPAELVTAVSLACDTGLGTRAAELAVAVSLREAVEMDQSPPAGSGQVAARLAPDR